MKKLLDFIHSVDNSHSDNEISKLVFVKDTIAVLINLLEYLSEWL